MSYLLDALKKAETERSSKDIEGTDTSLVIVQRPSALPVWLIVLIASLLLITIWQLSLSTSDTPHNENKNIDSVHTIVNAGESKKEVVSIAHISPVLSEANGFTPVKQPSQKKTNAPSYKLSEGEVLITPSSSESLFEGEQGTSIDPTQINNSDTKLGVDATPAKVKQLAELSKNQLNRIPSLSLQSHLYSSVAEYSSVVINGRNYSEGDFINSEIIIKKINVDGIVISLGGLLIELPKGISWVSQK